MLIKAQDDVLKCLVWSTTKRYSVHCHGGGNKPETCWNQRLFIPEKITQTN